MLKKTERTQERYMKAGAEMRLFKTLGSKLVCDISCVLSAPDQDMMLRALDKIDQVCSRAEDNMFRDHPYLPDEYVDVFYGSTDSEPRNEVDAEMILRAREVSDELFERKRHREEAR